MCHRSNADAQRILAQRLYYLFFTVDDEIANSEDDIHHLPHGAAGPEEDVLADGHKINSVAVLSFVEQGGEHERMRSQPQDTGELVAGGSEVLEHLEGRDEFGPRLIKVGLRKGVREQHRVVGVVTAEAPAAVAHQPREQALAATEIHAGGLAANPENGEQLIQDQPVADAARHLSHIDVDALVGLSLRQYRSVRRTKRSSQRLVRRSCYDGRRADKLLEIVDVVQVLKGWEPSK